MISKEYVINVIFLLGSNENRYKPKRKKNKYKISFKTSNILRNGAFSVMEALNKQYALNIKKGIKHFDLKIKLKSIFL